jgi:hypothetical protein
LNILKVYFYILKYFKKNHEMIQWKHYNCFPFGKKWKDVDIDLIPGIEEVTEDHKAKLILYKDTGEGRRIKDPVVAAEYKKMVNSKKKKPKE